MATVADRLETEFSRLQKEFRAATTQYNHADADHIDVAVHRLNAAREALNTYIKLRKAEDRWQR